MQTAKLEHTLMVTLAVTFMPLVIFSETYYASPGGTGAGTESSPCSLLSGINKVKATSDTLILKSGRYPLSGAIAFNGTESGNEPTRVLGETGDPADVVIDAQGKGEAFRINKNVLMAGVTVMNGSNAGFPSSSYNNRAAGIRIGWTGAEGTMSIVSNCVVTCCTNAFTSSSRVDGVVRYGGAVCVFDNGLLVDSRVTNNTAVYRCAGVVLNGGRVIGGSISHNAAVDGAGGLIVERGSSAFVADAEISGNSVGVNGSGGGVLCALDGSSLVLTNCTLSGNSSGYGGGVDAWSGTTLSCIDCRFIDNVAGHVGGGACVRGTCRADVLGCVFDGNSVTGTNNDTDFGGGLGAYGQTDGASLSVYGSMFRNNNSASRGGGFSGPWGVNNTSEKLVTHASLVNCVFTNNTSSGRGGGVCLRDNDQGDLESRFLMRNCLVAMNRTTNASAAEGAGVYFVAYANPILDSCTIVSNTTGSSYSGAGLYHRWGGTVTNCVIAFNVKGNSLETETTWCLDGNTSTPKSSAYRNCCVWPAAANVFLAANGCVNASPRFADPLHGDFTLAAGSPCRDAGVMEEWMVDAHDLNGNLRVIGSAPDMGCYERLPNGFIIRFW